MTTSLASLVDRALRTAGIPIDGVTIGNEADRATWVPAYTAAATPAHKSIAATLLSTLVVDAAALALEDQRASQLTVDSFSPATKAIVLALLDQLNIVRAALPVPLNPITPAQALNAIRVKAGTL